MTEAPDAERRPMVVAREMKKTYRLGGELVEALRDVSLTIHEGEFVTILGPSGSGKSTLLNLLGVIESPTSGELFIGDTAVATMPENQRAALRLRTIGFIFQSFNLFPQMTALQNVMMPMRLAGVPAGERRRRAQMLLESVGLGHRLKHHPPELSGGERQRVAIARALANRPRLLLADEPTGNLDSGTGTAIVELLHQLNERGLTVIMVTHNIEMTRGVDQVIQIRDGRVFQSPTI